MIHFRDSDKIIRKKKLDRDVNPTITAQINPNTCLFTLPLFRFSADAPAESGMTLSQNRPFGDMSDENHRNNCKKRASVRRHMALLRT